MSVETYALEVKNSTEKEWQVALYQGPLEKPGLKSIAWKVQKLSGSQQNTADISWDLTHVR